MPGVRHWAMPHLTPEEIETLERLAGKYEVPSGEVIGWARNYRVSSPPPDLAEESTKLSDLKRRAAELEEAVQALPSQVWLMLDRRLTRSQRGTSDDLLHIVALIQSMNLPTRTEKRGRPVTTDPRVVSLATFLARAWRDAHGHNRPLVSEGGEKNGETLPRRLNKGGEFVAAVIAAVAGYRITPAQLQTLTKPPKEKPMPDVITGFGQD